MAIDEQVLIEEKLVSGEELYHMGDIGRCELVDGRIVPMSPTGELHGGYEGDFYYEIRSFVRAHKLGKVRAADVLFISDERYAEKKSPSYLDVAPDLIVEVLSPDDTLSQMMQKLREYFAIGVRLVWVADPRASIVYAYRSTTDVREFTATDVLPGDDVLPGFAVPVVTLFED